MQLFLELRKKVNPVKIINLIDLYKNEKAIKDRIRKLIPLDEPKEKIITMDSMNIISYLKLLFENTIKYQDELS